jgi:hypothetical protein
MQRVVGPAYLFCAPKTAVLGQRFVSPFCTSPHASHMDPHPP